MMAVGVLVLLIVGSCAYDDEQSALLQASISNHYRDAEIIGANTSHSQGKHNFGLLHYLRQMKLCDKQLGILMLGLDNAGKTTILEHLSDEGGINHIMPTQGFKLNSVSVDGFKIISWDIGGQKAIRAFQRNYFGVTDLLIYVVDAADPHRLAEARTELRSLMEEEQLSGVPLLVFANKQDHVYAWQSQKIAEELDLYAYRERTNGKLNVVGCSAKSADGLQAGLEWGVQTSCTN